MDKLHTSNRILIVMMLTFSISCAQKENNLLQTNKAIVARQFDKWKNEEASFFELLEEKVIWEVSGKSPVSGTYIGKSDFMERAVNPIITHFKTALKPELISLFEESEFVWLHFRATAITTNNELYENTYVWKMQFENGKITRVIAFLDTYELTLLMENKNLTQNRIIEQTKKYIGMWVTEDGYIRHNLLQGNRYDEARGVRKGVYQGIYTITGNRIDYKDDTGFTADGEFKNGILYHAGMVLYKEENK